MLECWGCGLYTRAAYTRVFTVVKLSRKCDCIGHNVEPLTRETTRKQATRTQINKEALKAHGFSQKEGIVQNFLLALNICDIQPIRAINITKNLYVHWGI